MNNQQASDAVYVPVIYDEHENQPLLNRQPRQPKRGCTRGLLCKRCLAGTHENTRSRTILRRIVIVLSLLWFFWAVKHWVLDQAIWIDDNHCLHHLVPWNGPSTITSDTADSIEVAFDKGDITSAVEVLTRDDVSKLTVFIDAWVTKNYPEENEEEGIKEKEMGKSGHHHEAIKGLEVEVTEVGGKLTIVLSSEDNIGRRGRRWPHNKKFCAKVDIKIIFPSTLRSYNRLIVTGVLLDLDVRGVSKIAFDSILLRTTVGGIVLHDLETVGGAGGVQAKSLDISSVTGSIKIGSATPVHGHGLSVTLESTVGSIKVNATTNPISLGNGLVAQELRHNLNFKTNTGSIEAIVRPGSGYRSTALEKKGTTPGDLYFNGLSLVGHVATDVVLAPKQILHQELSANMGSVQSTISDNYLGSIDVRTDYGRASVTEVPNSASWIDYEESTKTVKVGHKSLQNGGKEEKGVMSLQSKHGGARLTFV
ncbi:hypothetical protein BG015_007478 [Linnemannia schmuckeri]|uniref:Adhesin domain-containing protein n=1 Tax=Linnemannia schmuckeri TaxID=64567 RepID=A0A9P5RYG1_9FUNG|nr:hypothetical protein BG015_007478 [Linnemannia schmuckeri]